MVSPLRACWSQVHPVFMMAAIGAAVVGGLYSPVSNPGNLLVFCAGVFSALYLAHVRDSYVDYFERHEDACFPLSRKQAELLMASSALIVLACMAYFVSQGLYAAIPIMLAGLLLAFLHAPFDLNPTGATAGYPTGLALAAIGGYYVQAGIVPFNIFLFAIAVWTVLCGVKIVDDIKDYEWDRKFGKIAAPVYLGKKRAKEVAVAVVAHGASFGVALTLFGLMPLYSAVSFLPMYAAAFASLSRNGRSTLYGLDAMLLGTYGFMLIQLAGPLLGLP